jgi:hypothetical protein
MGSVSRAPTSKTLQTHENVLENLCKYLEILC